MNYQTFVTDYRLVGTVALLVFAFLLNLLFKRFVRRGVKKFLPEIVQKRYNNLINIGMFLFVLFVLFGIWGFTIDNIWLFFTSVIGLVAIGFFAVWSILSNIVAGLIIMGMHRFKVGDELIFMPDKIRGRVKSMTLMFLVLKDKGYLILVPNNFVFQKYVKVKRL